MECIKGPDFPTGGIILGIAAAFAHAYAHRPRHASSCAREDRDRGDAERPSAHRRDGDPLHGQQGACWWRTIAELVARQAARGHHRHPRREPTARACASSSSSSSDVNSAVVLNYLYKHTQMQEILRRDHAGAGGRRAEGALTCKRCSYHYLEHQKDVIVRRTRYDLDKAEARAHILEGLLIALDNIDEIVRIIRNSPNTVEAKTQLMERFALTDKQAQAILDMRLWRA